MDSAHTDVTFDPAVYTVTVTVTESVENGVALMRVEASYEKKSSPEAEESEKADEIVFVNVKEPTPATPVDVPLYVKKTLQLADAEAAAPIKAYTFTFEISAAETNPKADPLKNLESDEVAVSVGPLTWEEAEELATLHYTEAGVYHYEVLERFDSDKPGVTYDEETHVVTVIVTETSGEAEELKLEAQVEIDGSEVDLAEPDSKAIIEFENIYHKDQTNVILRGQKTLKDGVLGDGQFTFTLTPVGAEVEQTVPVVAANVAAENGQNGQAQQIDVEEQVEDDQAVQSTEAEQNTQTAEAEQGSQATQNIEAEQGSQATQSAEAEQNNQTTEAEQGNQATQNAETEQDGQATQSIEAEQSDPIVQMDPAELQGDSMLKRTYNAAKTSGGHSFLDAASVDTRVVRSAPALLSDDVIVEPVDAPDVALTAELAEETISETDVETNETEMPAAETEPQSELQTTADEPGAAVDTVQDSGDAGVSAPEESDEADSEALEDSTQGDVAENGADAAVEEILVIPEEDEFAAAVEEGQEGDAAAVEDSGTEEEQEFDLTIDLIGEPIVVAPIAEVEEIAETTETVKLPAEQVPMPAGTTNGVATAVNGKSGTFDFGSILYTKPGAYHYEICEQKGEDTDRIAYDEAIYDVTVEVIRNESGELMVSGVTYAIRDRNDETKRLAEFTNRMRTGSLTVSKTVKASDESLIDESKAFQFKVTLDDEDINGTYGDMSFNSGVAEFSLRHGKSKTASGLPAGITYKVEESADETYAATAENESGTIQDGKEAQVLFTNELKESTPTPTPGDTPTPTPVETPTPTPEDMPTPTPGETPGETPTPTPTAVPEGMPTPTPGETPEGTPTPTPEDMPTPTPGEMPEGTPTPTPEDMPTPTPTELPEDMPTPTPTEIPEDMPTPTPTELPDVTPTPTASPTPTPTATPTPGAGSLTVTKTNRDSMTGETIVLVNAQFHVALFADAGLTQRIGEVQTIQFTGSSASGSVTFNNLGAGTYYVAETNAGGTPMNGGEFGGGVYQVRYAGGQQVTLASQGSRAEFAFENLFSTLPDPQHYRNAKTLTITKKVESSDGAAMDSKKVFYAGIFADAGYTQLADHVSQNIVALEMNGNSSASATVEITVPSEGETRLYVTEVNKKGTPVGNSGSFGYEVSVVGGLLSLNINSGNPSVTITNTAVGEPETETESEDDGAASPGGGGTGGGAGPVSNGTSAAQTGDETPVGLMLLLMLTSSAALLAAARKSRRF